MDEHETCLGASDDWYTPPAIFAALGLTFDLDPCSPGTGHWVPARAIYTKADDGLTRDWSGCVFMNPPFGGRNGHVPWLDKFLAHGNGVAIVRAYTSSAWFHDFAVRAETMVFPRGKTKFIRPDGSVGLAPGHGVVLLGMGAEANEALRRSGLGLFVPVRYARSVSVPSDLVALLRADGTDKEWDDQRQMAATEIERLRQHIEWVTDCSNDLAIVTHSRRTLGIPISCGHPAT